MPDDVRDIRDYYDRDPDYEEERLSRHQLEFELTLRILNDYLPEGANILELGAGTGRYTLALAERGHRGVAVDFAGALVERCRQRLEHNGVTGWRTVVADARDRLVDGGLCFSAWISRFGILGDLMRNVPDWIERDDEVTSVLAEGRDPSGPRVGFRGYFARADEIGPIHEEVGFESLALAGVEPAISAYDESYNRLEEPLRAKWRDLLHSICTEPSIVGASRHLLHVGRKRRAAVRNRTGGR